MGVDRLGIGRMDSIKVSLKVGMGWKERRNGFLV